MLVIRAIIALGVLGSWTAYWGWQVYTETGLYAVAVRRVVDFFGSVDAPFITFMGWTLGCVVLIVPLILIFRLLGISQSPVQAPQPHDPSASARRAGVFCLVLALFIGASAGGAYFYAQTLPDGTEAPQLISASKGLAADFPMSTKVLLEGDRYNELGAILTETSDNSYSETHYVPVVPTGVNPRSVEIQFIEVYRTRDENFPASVFSDEGYISQTTVELLARDVMVDAGVTLAETTYLIETSSGGPRLDVTIMSYIAMFVAALFFVIGLYLRATKPETA